jgi:hypothetical protein
MDKKRYLIHKANGTLERFRGDEISRLIRKKYPLSAQIALLMDRDTKPEEFKEYQAYRQECKEKVDAEIEKIKAEVEL